MLVNLSPRNDYKAKMEQNIKLFNKDWNMRYKPMKFREMFRKTEFVGVYYSNADDNEIHLWCKQEPYWYNFFHKADTSLNAMHNAWNFGVADNAEQVVAYYNANEDGYFHGNHVILLREIVKGKDGGWRWHKWGRYIGTQNPQCEYLADEPEIEKVVCFSIYKVR